MLASQMKSALALTLGLCHAVCLGWAFVFAPPPSRPADAIGHQHARPRQHSFRARSTTMLTAADGVTVVIIEGGGSGYRLEASCLDPETGVRRRWVVKRSQTDFDDFNTYLLDVFGYEAVPALPPPGAPLPVLETYLGRLLDIPRVLSTPAIYDFLDVPADVVDEPVLLAEVVEDARRWPTRSANPWEQQQQQSARRRRRRDGGRGGWGGAWSRWSEESEEQPPSSEEFASDRRSRSAGVAGAVVGGLLGGPVGALLGSIAGSKAAERDDVIGDVAKQAGAAADATIDRAKELDREFDITGRAGKAAAEAVSVAQKVDEEYHIREKAKGVLRTVEKTVKKSVDGIADAVAEGRRRD